MARLEYAFCIVALAWLGAPSAAQWAATSYEPSEPVVAEGFLLLHENPDVRVFSAAARQWRTIAPRDAAVLGTGDWTVLVRDTDHYVGYSARRNDTALLDPTGTLVQAFVDDDVALVVETPMFAPAVAHGYSAVTNTWSSVVLDELPDVDEIAISRFVIGIQDDLAYHGFAARTGAWQTLETAHDGHEPVANGNVLLADLADPAGGTGGNVLAAFSGVRGNWAVSPKYLLSSKAILVGANVAYARGAFSELPNAKRFRALGFSAYEGKWDLSPVVRKLDSISGELVQDNLVLIGSDESHLGFEGFGAEPGRWSQRTGVWNLLAHEASYAVLGNSAGTELWAFSGVDTGTWTLQPISGPPTFVGSGDHNGVIRVGSLLYGFMPIDSAWAAPMTVTGSALVTSEDALVDARDVFFMACAARGGEWKTGPVVPNAAFDTLSAGSVVVHQQLFGDGAGDLYAFDERIGQWPQPFNPGGLFTLEAGRNLVLAHALPGLPSDESECSGIAAWGYSVQRGDWTAPDGFGSLTATGVSDDVAWVVLDDETLWAFAAPTEGHVYYDWPNGTEYHTSGTSPAMSDPFVAYGVHAGLGDLVWGLVAPKGAAPPYSIPGVQGDLWLNPLQVVSLGYWGTIGSDGVLEQVFELSGALPAGVELVFQPLILEVDGFTLRFGDRCDPGWFF